MVTYRQRTSLLTLKLNANTEETKQLLSLYRLLRHLAEIPWLLERGFKVLAERNMAALKDSFLSHLTSLC
jgi:hypothetical protein